MMIFAPGRAPSPRAGASDQGESTQDRASTPAVWRSPCPGLVINTITGPADRVPGVATMPLRAGRGTATSTPDAERSPNEHPQVEPATADDLDPGRTPTHEARAHSVGGAGIVCSREMH